MKILIVFILILFVIYFVNKITVYPFIKIFRALINLDKESVKIDDYIDEIKNVQQSEKIKIPVENNPSAEVVFYSPDNTEEKLPVIVYIHGGGWCLGNAKQISSFVKLLASNGYVVANVEYALAPEYPYPTSTVQLAAVLNYVYENADEYKIDNKRIFIGGNSAGAHISSQLGALISNRKFADDVGVDIKVPRENLKGLLLYNGVYNFKNVDDSKLPGLSKLIWAYTGKKNYLEFEKLDEISTINHIDENYPATFITVGDADSLEFQTLEFIEKLKDNNIDCESVLWTGKNVNLNHDYIYRLDLEPTKEAYKKTIEFLNKKAQM